MPADLFATAAAAARVAAPAPPMPRASAPAPPSGAPAPADALAAHPAAAQAQAPPSLAAVRAALKADVAAGASARRLAPASPPSERKEAKVLGRAFPIGEEDTAARALMRLGDGVPLPFRGDGAPTVRALVGEYRQRLQAQDAASVALLVAGLALTSLVSLAVVYQAAEDPSPVLFYNDPKYAHTVQPRNVCSSADADAFLQAFNSPPQIARLRVVGRACDEDSRGSSSGARVCCGARWWWLRSLGACASRHRDDHASQQPGNVAFDVSLDLTPFVAGDGRLASEADAQALERHLHARNPLEVIVLRKQVVWQNWEDVATNAKQALRGLGFLGTVDVRLEGHEEVVVFRNHPWQNFVRSPAAQVLVVLTLVGALVWVPYLWARQRTVRVESRFWVNVDPERYWEHLGPGLHPAHGYRPEGQAPGG